MRFLTSVTTREVDELQQDEHIHAAASIGGVLNGIFITPYTTSMEHKIPHKSRQRATSYP